jgi:hypothetical protein
MEIKTWDWIVNWLGFIYLKFAHCTSSHYLTLGGGVFSATIITVLMDLFLFQNYNDLRNQKNLHIPELLLLNSKSKIIPNFMYSRMESCK